MDSSIVLGDIIRDTGGAFRIIYCKLGKRVYASLLIKKFEEPLRKIRERRNGITHGR